jgi:hypothetical protein
MKMQVSAGERKRLGLMTMARPISLKQLDKSALETARDKPLGFKYFLLRQLLQNVCI